MGFKMVITTGFRMSGSSRMGFKMVITTGFQGFKGFKMSGSSRMGFNPILGDVRDVRSLGGAG